MTTPEWRVPEPLDTIEVEATGGTRIILRRHGDVKGPRLVLSHDNGLAIDLYYPFWSRLASRFELIVYDLRNHGLNPAADLADHSVATFTADDARIRAAIEEHFGAKPAIGVFHSLSAMIALNQDPPGRGYAGLVLFDYGFAYVFEPDTTDFACPVKVIGGDPGVEFSSLPSVDLEGLIGWDYDFIPHTTHFLQLEHPEECVSTMVAFLEQAGLA